MRRIRHYAFLGLILMFFEGTHAQFRSIIVSAPKNSLIAGEQVQLFAVAWDGNGALSFDGFAWVSDDAEVVAVGQEGVARAGKIGIANVTVSIDGASTFLSLQVEPLRVDLAAAASEVFVGDSVQFTATPVDINGIPIADTEFRWNVLSPGGYSTQTASIDETGLMQALGAGPVSVQAVLDLYGDVVQTERRIASTQVVISRRPEFRLTRLLATDPIEDSFSIDPAGWVGLVANDSGQIAFVTPLGGLTSGLVRYDNGRLDLLASAGTPGVFPQSVVQWFRSVAIDNSGQVLNSRETLLHSLGRGSLVLSSLSGASVVLVFGQTLGIFQEISNFTLSRHSLNDRGDIVFHGTYSLPGPIYGWNGIFKVVDGRLQVVWGNTLPLAEFPDGFDIDYDFGMDGSGVVYFIVRKDGTDAVYSADGLSPPRKILMTGDMIEDGSVVEQIDRLTGVAPNGTLAFNLRVSGRGRPAIVDATGHTRFLDPDGLREFETIHSVNSNGEAVFTGDAGEGRGFYRWNHESVDAAFARG